MKTAIPIVLALAGLAFGAAQLQAVRKLRAENEALRARLANMKAEGEAAARETGKQRDAEVARLKKQLEELHQLRGDVARLQGQADEAARLRAANERLRVRASAQPTVAADGLSAPVEPLPSVQPNSFPKADWSFAGYETPENALVTAIWAMQQGTPETYLDSLAPEEQVRMAQRWQGKSEEEIAAKHQSDVTRITGITVNGREDIDADNIVMNVQIEGVNRAEKVSMKRVDGQWKFGGYIREPEQ